MPQSVPQLTDNEFDAACVVIRDFTGISLGHTKHELVHRRLSGRLKALQIESFSEYLNYLKQGDEVELEAFCNAVTTNLTSFFRERHHFEFLGQTILPNIISNQSIQNRRVRIWSAGCSTGEEPYCIAMTLKQEHQLTPQWDTKVLSTDLDTQVLATCRAGLYPENRVEKIPPQLLRRWFRTCTQQDGPPCYQVHPQLQQLITFKQLNLMEEWPMKGPFDVIFCRNVIIYFDKPTQRTLIERYANILAEDGYLILGHSENLLDVSDRFSLIGKTIYQKISQ
ncbi:MAG: protein-glutamate O-methyltransferase CheR [Gammaproteobacteria bacterium]|nr:protein-glutamate O-methyltransferase CheR [Gammaproteobacteria bacterium]